MLLGVSASVYHNLNKDFGHMIKQSVDTFCLVLLFIFFVTVNMQPPNTPVSISIIICCYVGRHYRRATCLVDPFDYKRVSVIRLFVAKDHSKQGFVRAAHNISFALDTSAAAQGSPHLSRPIDQIK